jgi:FkbM family methyltransferase
MPRVGRTRFLLLVTRLGHERLLRIERLRRSRPLVRALLAPLRWWVRRGSTRVVGGLGHGLRLPLAHIPLSHAHAGAMPRGWLEIDVQEAIKRLLAQGDVFYDIGANIGFFALVGARQVGPDGAAYAFEPVPDNAQAIREGAKLNGLPNLEVIEGAVGSRAGRDRLLLVEDLSWSHLESQGGWHPGTVDTLEVEVVTIDELVRSGRIRPPDLVKIDVEGAEVDVLRGMRATIEEHQPAIVCELHGTAPEFLETMEALGYASENLGAKQSLLEAPPPAHAVATARQGSPASTSPRTSSATRS